MERPGPVRRSDSSVQLSADLLAHHPPRSFHSLTQPMRSHQRPRAGSDAPTKPAGKQQPGAGKQQPGAGKQQPGAGKQQQQPAAAAAAAAGELPAELLEQLAALGAAAPQAELLESMEGSAGYDNLLRAVVKVLVVAVSPNFLMPWQMGEQEEFSGSGFIIPGRRVITNYHVVENHSTVRLRRHNSSRLFPARVLCSSPHCDLALLTVDGDAFWDGVEPLEFAKLPKLYDDVMVIGYPIGGDNVSVTRGVVSRIDTTSYSARTVDTSPDLLVVQIDAAINFGNSGGPACDDAGRVVGVAFSGLFAAQNVGYIIPLPVLHHFLEQFERFGEFRGICELGIAFEELQNETIRRRYKLAPAQETGVLITRLFPLSPLRDVVQKRDVLLSIDGTEIANDGTVLFGPARTRLHYSVLVTLKHPDEEITLTLLRDGALLTRSAKLGPMPQLIPRYYGFDANTSYFIFGGLVFIALSIPLVNAVLEDVDDAGRATLLLTSLTDAVHSKMKNRDEQYVVVHKVLIADVNYGYSSLRIPAKVKRVNGADVKNLTGLMRELLCKARDAEFVELDLEGGDMIVLDRAECVSSQKQILKLHNIPSPVSDDLRDAYAACEPARAGASPPPSSKRAH